MRAKEIFFGACAVGRVAAVGLQKRCVSHCLQLEFDDDDDVYWHLNFIDPARHNELAIICLRLGIMSENRRRRLDEINFCWTHAEALLHRDRAEVICGTYAPMQYSVDGL